MKTFVKVVTGGMFTLMSVFSMAQQIDELRMARDIEVAENVLSTLLRQQFDRQHMFFPLEVEGNYEPGYGVTFRLPPDFTTPMAFYFNLSDDNFIFNDQQGGPLQNMPPMPQISYDDQQIVIGNVHNNVSFRDEDESRERDRELREEEKNKIKDKKGKKELKDDVVIKKKYAIDRDKMREKKKASLDSVQELYNSKVIEASKSFLADYGDLISQLAPGERIIITNQGEQPRMWVGKLGNTNRTHLSVEVLKGDLTQYKQGKLNHDQLVSKIKVVNTETVETVDPDIELLSSIFDRLYQPDLSRTFFTQNNIYYERLKDFGVVYYMQVFSSNQQQSDFNAFSMPTLKLDDLDQEERDAKVKEIYPAFEKELKQNMLEYGRTLKSLKDNEVLVFNVKNTKCVGCGIPSSVEFSIKYSVLKDFNSGKMEEKAALEKFIVKKGAEQ